MVSRAEWNELADDFEDMVVDVASEETNDQLARFVGATRLTKRAVLVDLGCGIGTFIKKFGNRFGEIDAVEFAPRIIARAKAECRGIKGIRWFTMDVARAGRRVGERADLTVCMNVITSTSAAKRAAQWAAVRTVTKPSRFALVVVPSVESERIVQRLSPPDGDATPGITAEGHAEKGGSWQKHYNRAELVAVITRHGFDVRRMGRIYAPWSREGMRKPRSSTVKGPWDWICLAQRRA